MKIGLVGPSNRERSLPFDAQRTINLFPVFDQKGKEISALYGTPGLGLFSTCGVGPGRGCFTAANGRAFVVANSGLYELTSGGAATLLGSLDTSTGIVSIDENGVQLAICDGEDVYILTYSGNSFAKVSDGDLPSSGTLTFIDGYFVVSANDSGKFYISALYDGTAWAALDFATAESSPDELLRVYNAVGQLWLLGTKTTEIWTNTGASAFPFERIAGAKMEVGILAPHTAVAVDNSLFWVGRDDIGSGIVYRAQGFSPQRISTDAIEQIIQRAETPETLRAYTYQQDGHAFYVITGGGMDTTLVYDISTRMWHERAFLNPIGVYEQHLGVCSMFAFGKQLIVSRQNGKVYHMAMSYYDDDGAAIKRERVLPHIYNEGERFRASQLLVDFETGGGVTLASLYQPVDLTENNPIWGEIDNLFPGDAATVSGSSFLTITSDYTEVLQVGDSIKLEDATGFQGIPASALNAEHVIYSIVNEGAFTIDVGVPATGTGTNPGFIAIKFQLLTFHAPAHGLHRGDRIRIRGAEPITDEDYTADQMNSDFYARTYSSLYDTEDYFAVKTDVYTSIGTHGGGDDATFQRLVNQDPVAALSISRDGGHTWSSEYTASIGAIGARKARAVWRRLGYAAQMTFKVTTTAATKIAISGAYLK